MQREQVGGKKQVLVTFVTKDPNPKYHLPNGSPSITVPADSTRYGLSQIVNHLLGLDQVVPFEFLVENNVLCSSLGAHISSQGISAEGVLEIEYFPAALPPKPRDDFVHDDWISCATVIGASNVSDTSHSSANQDEDWVLASGCYDGLVKFWNGSGDVIRQYVAHAHPIKSCTAIEDMQLLTTADDGSVHVWEVAPSEDEVSVSQDGRLLARLTGHRSSVEASSVRPGGERCVTSGWDKEILVWKSGESLATEAASMAPTEPTPKRKKKGSSKDSVTSNSSLETKIAESAVCSSIGSLSGHTQAVSGLKWANQEHLVSCSWDHTIKVWDVEMETALDSFTHNKVIYCVDTPNTSTHANVIVFGGAERGVRLWDRRESHKQATFTRALQSFESHSGWVSDVKWHPTSEHMILSASFDGSIKLWDIRSAIPLWTVDASDGGDEDKLFCCTWISEKAIAYGGTNRTLCTMAMNSSDGSPHM